jgi:hypothetical protein
VLVDEVKRELTLLRSDTPEQTLGDDDTLRLDDVIPQFALPLSRLFSK